MLRPGCFKRAHIAPSPTARRVGGPHGPPTSRAVRSGEPRASPDIASDTRAADAVLPAAAGGLAAGIKARNRLPIYVDDLAIAVDFQSAIGIVDGQRDQRGIEWRLGDLVHHWLLEVSVLAGVGEGVEPGDGFLEIFERHVLEPVAHHQPGKLSKRIRLEEG